MTKTKLGISVGLFGAAMYFMGLITILPLVIMAGYVLLFEDNAWLKRTAVKALAIVMFFSVLSTLLGLLSSSHVLINDFVMLFGDRPLNMSVFIRIISICRTVLSVLQSIVLLLAGFKALTMGNISVPVVDKLINSHLSFEKPQATE